MPKSAVGTRVKTRREPYHQRSAPVVRDSREVYPGVNYKEPWKELVGRFYDQALLLTSQPKSKMTKKALLKLFDEMWDLIPETPQRVGRGDLPEKMLYREPEESWKEEVDDGES